MPLLGRFGSELARNGLFQRCRRRAFRNRGVRCRSFLKARLASFEQRVLLDLSVDKLGELKVRKLQLLDRLLQLRRHDQRLCLTQLQPLRVTRSIQIALRPGAAYRLNLSPR